MDDLKSAQAWHRAKDWNEGDLATSTTLGRLDRDIARKLVGRGYINTYLMSWLIETPSDVHRDVEACLGGLSERIEGLLPPA